MDTKTERALRTERLFRNVNEAIAENADNGHLHIVCECDDASCTDRLHVPVDAYAEIREDSSLFVVEPGHANPEVERVVDEGTGYTVVEKPAA